MRKLIWALGAAKFNSVAYSEKGLSVPFVFFLPSSLLERLNLT